MKNTDKPKKIPMKNADKLKKKLLNNADKTTKKVSKVYSQNYLIHLQESDKKYGNVQCLPK